MRSTLSTLAVRAALLGGLAAAAPVWAGSAEVQFVKPEQFTDARDGALRREDTLAALEKHFKQLAATRLPANQVLSVEVLDVDLAGDAWPRTGLRDIRVLRGLADWPRLELRYTLREGDRVVASGTEHVSDMAYLTSSPPGLDDGPLPYERRMLDRWFRDRFGAPR